MRAVMIVISLLLAAQSYPTLAPHGHLSDVPKVHDLTFSDGGKPVFTIHLDSGKVDFGPGFTTTDAASKLFIRGVAQQMALPDCKEPGK